MKMCFELSYHIIFVVSGFKTFYNSGFLYEVYFAPMTWHEAEQHCQTRGAHLPSITSRTESDFLAAFSTRDFNCAGFGNFYLRYLH